MAKLGRLYIRATSEELEGWRRSATAAGAASLSAYVRDLLAGQPERAETLPVEPKEDWRVVLERLAAR